MKKVLLIDDDESILDAISLILEDEGYLIKTTLKGEEAYHTVAEFMPDVILLDVLLSGKDGREICKNLKANPSLKHIPIILISAHPNAEKSIKTCGADYFLAKPFDTEILLKTVKKSAQ